MTDEAKMTERAQLAHQIAKFQHSNESLHRHPVDGVTCSYCDLVGHYAVRTMLEHPDLMLALLLETGALEQCGWLMAHGGFVGPSFPETHGLDRDDLLPVYRFRASEEPTDAG